MLSRAFPRVSLTFAHILQFQGFLYFHLRYSSGRSRMEVSENHDHPGQGSNCNTCMLSSNSLKMLSSRVQLQFLFLGSFLHFHILRCLIFSSILEKNPFSMSSLHLRLMDHCISQLTLSGMATVHGQSPWPLMLTVLCGMLCTLSH